jgi:hypothetical protein
MLYPKGIIAMLKKLNDVTIKAKLFLGFGIICLLFVIHKENKASKETI